jgi:hypothetical protein
MRFTLSFIRPAGMALTWAVLCGTCAHGSATTTPSAEKKDSVPPKMLLSPELEAKFKDFVDKGKVEKAKIWNLRMKKEIESVAKATGLGEEGVKSLQEPAKHAVELAIDEWGIKSGDMLRKQLSLMPPEQVSMVLDQRLAQVAALANSSWSPNSEPPFEEDDWIKALHQTLTPDQITAWDKAQADRKEVVEKEIDKTLKAGVDRIHEAQMQEILSESGAIESTLNLPKDRSAKLEDLAKSVVDQTTEMWRKRVENMLLAMEDQQRHQYTMNGNIFIGTEADEAPAEQAAWKDGVASLLTADEMTRLQAARDARKAKREHVMGLLMLVQLDEKIAFTDAQRQRLDPITDRLAKDVLELVPGAGGNIYKNGYSPGVFLTAAAKATDSELKPILDDVQIKRWRHLATPDSATPNTSTDGKSKPEKNLEPEDVEKTISAFLYDKAEKERKRMEETNILKAEDVARVTGLNAEVSSRLQAAARGATEEYLATWRWFTEQQIRTQLQDVTPQNVKQRLDNLQDYLFQRNFGLPNHQGVWDETVKVSLSPAQQAAWQKETDARAAFREKAVAAFVMAEFDRRNQLTVDQYGKLEPIITKVIRDNSTEISQIFSSSFNQTPWYLEGFYSLLPFAGVDDADLKAILTKDQVDRWHASPECANATSLWQGIQQMHNQRVRVMSR